MPARGKREAGSGALRQLPSGRWQARFRGPDGAMRPAPVTFDTKLDANAWLRAQARDVAADRWSAPTEKVKAGTIRDYAATWLASRDLKPRTRSEYQRLLNGCILPDLGDVPVDRLTPSTVRAWHAGLKPNAPTERARAYGLLRAIMVTAIADELRSDNPCRVRGAGSASKVHQTKTASLGELEVIVGAMPPRYRAMVLLAAWCGLRFGALAELRRDDVALDAGVLHVRRGVTRTTGAVHIGDPKSQAGRRTVSVPPHLLPVLRDHLAEHVGQGGKALLFPARGGQHMAPSSLYKVWYPARAAAGRSDLRFHDLRHTGATLAAATGATLAELMARLGHSTPAAALRYQHAAADRDRAIAEALSGFASANVVPLRASRGTA